MTASRFFPVLLTLVLAAVATSCPMPGLGPTGRPTPRPTGGGFSPSLLPLPTPEPTPTPVGTPAPEPSASLLPTAPPSTSPSLEPMPSATPDPTPTPLPTPTPPPTAGSLNLAYAGMPADSWTVGSPMAHERIGLSAGALNGRLYVIGGDGAPTMELYDPGFDSWQVLPLATVGNPALEAFAPTRSRYFGTAVVASGRLFYVGGTTHALRPYLDIYDPEAHAWLDLWSPHFNDARFARMAHASVHLNGLLYLIGGLMDPLAGGDAVPTADVYAISTVTQENYLQTALPSPRAGLGAAVLDNRLFVVGGYDVLPARGAARATSGLLCYRNGEWTDKTPAGEPLAPLNVPRHSFGSAVLDGKWYVAGGMDGSGAVLDSVEEYDPAANAWRLKAPMPTARVHFALAALGERLYALGGYDAASRQLRSTDVYRP